MNQSQYQYDQFATLHQIRESKTLRALEPCQNHDNELDAIIDITTAEIIRGFLNQVLYLKNRNLLFRDTFTGMLRENTRYDD